MFDTITKKTHPREWAIIKKVLPNYRKRTAILNHQDSVRLHGRYWDGGSRTTWFTMHRNGIVHQIASRNDYPFTAPEMEISITDGVVVVSAGTFCGKPSTACLYINA